MFRIVCVLLSAVLLMQPVLCAQAQEWRTIAATVDANAAAAIADAEATLRNAASAGDKKSELRALRILSLAYLRLRDFGRLNDTTERGIALAQALDHAEALADFLGYRAVITEAHGEPGKALAQLDEAIVLAHARGVPRAAAMLEFRKGGMYDTLGRNAEALASFHTAYRLFDGADDDQYAAATLNSLGHVYSKEGAAPDDLAQAQDYYQRALQRVGANSEGLVAIEGYHGLGTVYHRRKEFAQARAYYERSFALARARNTFDALGGELLLGRLAKDEGRFGAALQHVERALTAAREKNDLQSVFHAELLLAEVQAQEGRKSASLAALAAARADLARINSRAFDVTYFARAAEIHALFGEHEQAYRLLQSLRAADRRLDEAANARLAEELNVRFGLKLREAENAVLRAQQKTEETRRLALWVALTLAVLLLLTLALYSRRRAAAAKSESLHHKALAESEAGRARAAREASEAKSRFLANMSHELRTPLNAILGFAQLLRVDRTLNERQARAIATIEQSGEHLLSVIEDILDVARIEAGRFELSAEPVALPKLITLVADLVRVSAEQKGVRFTYELPLDLPGVIVADEKRLRQVLLNLLGNAVKFTDRGAVTLQIEPLPAPAARARLRFEVRDTGVGIPADKLDAIFQPFEQAGERMQRIGGTGLGLTISRQLVRAMGGEIRVESTPGQGSRFRFELEFPLGAAAAAGALRAPEIVGYEGPRRKVLIVDDVEENRALLRQLLTRLEFNVYEAADGENGIAVAQATRPDLILLDSVMPVMDGIEATRRLRAIPEQSAVPIIVISAATSSTDRERSLANGASAFLAKPVVLHGLLQEMGSLLRLTWKY